MSHRNSKGDELISLGADLLRLAENCVDAGLHDVAFGLRRVARRLAEFTDTPPEYKEIDPFRSDAFRDDLIRDTRRKR